MSGKEDFSAIVIGHLDSNLRLPKGFHYRRRKSEFELFPDISNELNFHVPSYVWSEYAAWFENSSITNKQGTTGLLHYRCVLNLTFFKSALLPMPLRRIYFWELKRRSREYEDFLIVGTPNETRVSVWEQYVSSHPESEDLLEKACDIYDSETSNQAGTAVARLKSLKRYYPRSIFLTDSTFANDWLQLSIRIAAKLDSKVSDFPENRWGGFILERLFTLFVQDYQRTHKVNFQTKDQVYFVDSLHWIKANLLKIRLIRSLKSLNN